MQISDRTFIYPIDIYEDMINRQYKRNKQDVPPRSFKTVVDAHWGFHKVELDEESRRLTIFITPWGRYQYCRTPMGHCSATDTYTERFGNAVCGFPRKYKGVDHTLLHDQDVEQAFWHTYNILKLCADKGIT